MNTKQAAEQLGVGVARVNQLISSGRLIAQKDKNGFWNIRQSALKSVMNRKAGYPKGRARKGNGAK